MANSLISGTGPAIAPAPDVAPVSASETVPTWGYEIETGAAKLFDLKPGTKLPAGYADNPDKAKSEDRNGDDTAGAQPE